MLVGFYAGVSWEFAPWSWDFMLGYRGNLHRARGILCYGIVGICTVLVGFYAGVSWEFVPCLWDIFAMSSWGHAGSSLGLETVFVACGNF